jgi:hypothetical protein
MKLLPKLILVSACCWAASAQAQQCKITPGGLSCPPGSPGDKWIGHLGALMQSLQLRLALPAPLPGSPSFGTTKAAVHTQFAAVILYNFQNNTSLNGQISQMAQIELARLSRQYYIESNGNMAPLLAVAAQKLTAANLILIAAAFGQANVDAAVAAYAPAATKATYGASSRMAIMDRSQARFVAMGISGVTASPNLDMTLYEIFLDYLTAGTDTTVAAALAQTSSYAGGWLGAAATFGYSVGTGIYWIDDQIDPDINIYLGNEIGKAVDVAISLVQTIVADFTPTEETETATQDDWDWTPD